MATMLTPKYRMVFDHDITLESLATMTLWRGPMRIHRVTFLHLSSCLSDDTGFKMHGPGSVHTARVAQQCLHANCPQMIAQAT